MSERKVLNKYYPPDFDPSKIPKLKLPKDRQYVVRLMAPFNMRCKTCGEYIYKGKKFNARKETVQNEAYLGLPIFRFYIKCTRCLAEITFKTDPENTDYTMEHGATRNFQAEKLLEEEEKRVQKEREDEELNNPMKAPKAKRKAESWERSVGTLGSRPQLSGLVVVKKTDLGCSTRQGLASPTSQGPVRSSKAADPAPRLPGTSSLSQLGAYSDSEDSSGSN